MSNNKKATKGQREFATICATRASEMIRKMVEDGTFDIMLAEPKRFGYKEDLSVMEISAKICENMFWRAAGQVGQLDMKGNKVEAMLIHEVYFIKETYDDSVTWRSGLEFYTGAKKHYYKVKDMYGHEDSMADDCDSLYEACLVIAERIGMAIKQYGDTIVAFEYVVNENKVDGVTKYHPVLITFTDIARLRKEAKAKKEVK